VSGIFLKSLCKCAGIDEEGGEGGDGFGEQGMVL
jgi:hypothetical protein